MKRFQMNAAPLNQAPEFTTVLYRYEVTKTVWRDAPPGEQHTVEFSDRDGDPVDVFDERLPGKFLDVAKNST